MRKQFQTRLVVLQAEYESGKRLITELEQKQAQLRETLLRISGAIQVIEEELAKPESAPVGLAIDGVGMTKA